MIGPVLIAIWLGVIFLMIIGFGYSYFWSASTIIYFLMRRKVDDTEMDEVYLEEEDSEEPYSAPAVHPPATPQPAPAGSSLPMVEPPLRPSTPPPSSPPSAPAPMESSAPNPSDGSTNPESGS
jgi:hypothetical protein